MGSINIEENINHFLVDFEKRHFYPAFRTITNGVNEPECVVDGKKYLMFCSNNYLALSQNKAVKEAGKQAIDKYGLGPGGSPVISGYLDITAELESRIAKMTETEDCLTFPTGYMANSSVFQALMDPLFGNYPVSSENSVIFSDEYNHGSIVDGCRLSKAQKVVFKHNDTEDLTRLIKENNLPNKLIVTEGVFSLDGEIINLPEYIKIARDNNAKLMIDDAHGVGILGKNGGGTPQHYDSIKGVDILMGCMDKAFGGTGGYLCGNKTLIKYLRIAARSSILSSSLPAGMAGAMVESVNQMEAGQELREQLFERASYARQSFINAGFKILGNDILPAIPLYVGDDDKGIKFADRLWEKGIDSPIIRWPAVPQNQSRFRIIIMVDHSHEQIDYYVESSREIAKDLKVI